MAATRHDAFSFVFFLWGVVALAALALPTSFARAQSYFFPGSGFSNGGMMSRFSFMPNSGLGNGSSMRFANSFNGSGLNGSRFNGGFNFFNNSVSSVVFSRNVFPNSFVPSRNVYRNSFFAPPQHTSSFFIPRRSVFFGY